MKPIKIIKLTKVSFNTAIDVLNTLQFNLKVSNNPVQPLDKLGEWEKSQNAKSQIDTYRNVFYRYRNLTNPFELVSSRDRKYISIPNIITISRAYFKLWEILQYFQDVTPNGPMIYAALAEGPGGFMQAVTEFRLKYYYMYSPMDRIYGITLHNTFDNIQWNNALMRSSKYELSYGHPDINDGDLTNPKNIKAFTQLFSIDKADLVTADGGIMTTQTENFQEQTHLRLFLNEILTTLGIQAKDGTYVMKIYDMFTLPTLQLIYVLTLLYEDVYITKPLTSRPANSEKYLVCFGFREEIKKKVIDSLFNISTELFSMTTNKHIISLFDNLIPNAFYGQIFSCNNSFVPNQIKNIMLTIHLINNHELLRNKCVSKQIKYGIEWCKNNDIDVFYKSKKRKKQSLRMSKSEHINNQL